METIDAVIQQLNTIVAEAKHRAHRIGYFAALYKRMTMAVAEGIRTGVFEDGARMEKLDVLFAKRYLDAYAAFCGGQACTRSWRFVFTACESNDLTVIQHLLLGINTHINLDLAIAAAQVSEGVEVALLENDFNKINTLISSLIDDVQACLSKVWFPMRWLTRISNERHVPVINFSIDRARTASWANAVLLTAMTRQQQALYIQQMDGIVLALAQQIQTPGTLTRWGLKAILATEFKAVDQTIQLIETTVVD